MGRAASTGDDGTQTARLRLFGPGKHLVRHAVRRQDPGLEWNAEFLQHCHGVLHDFPI